MLPWISGVKGRERGETLHCDTDQGVAKAAMNRTHSRTLRARRGHWDRSKSCVILLCEPYYFAGRATILATGSQDRMMEARVNGLPSALKKW